MTEQEILKQKIADAADATVRAKDFEVQCLMMYRESVLGVEAAKSLLETLRGEYKELYG